MEGSGIPKRGPGCGGWGKCSVCNYQSSVCSHELSSGIVSELLNLEEAGCFGNSHACCCLLVRYELHWFHASIDSLCRACNSVDALQGTTSYSDHMDWGWHACREEVGTGVDDTRVLDHALCSGSSMLTSAL